MHCFFKLFIPLLKKKKKAFHPSTYKYIVVNLSYVAARKFINATTCVQNQNIDEVLTKFSLIIFMI